MNLRDKIRQRHPDAFDHKLQKKILKWIRKTPEGGSFICRIPYHVDLRQWLSQQGLHFKVDRVIDDLFEVHKTKRPPKKIRRHIKKLCYEAVRNGDGGVTIRDPKDNGQTEDWLISEGLIITHPGQFIRISWEGLSNAL